MAAELRFPRTGQQSRTLMPNKILPVCAALGSSRASPGRAASLRGALTQRPNYLSHLLAPILRMSALPCT